MLKITTLVILGEPAVPGESRQAEDNKKQEAFLHVLLVSCYHGRTYLSRSVINARIRNKEGRMKFEVKEM